MRCIAVLTLDDVRSNVESACQCTSATSHSIEYVLYLPDRYGGDEDQAPSSALLADRRPSLGSGAIV